MLEWVELSAPEASFAAGVLLLASFVRGYSGFGFSAVLVAGLAFVVDPIAAVPLAIAFEVVASIVQGRSIRSEIRWPDFWKLLAAAVVGNPIGVMLLTTTDSDVLRAATFAGLFVLSAALLVRRTAVIAPSHAIVFTIGMVAGIVNGATAMSGLVLVLAMSFISISPAEIRATLVAYFFASDVVVLGILALQNELTDELFWRVLAGLPLLTLGIAVGSRLFRVSSAAAFRRVTLALLMAISIAGLIRMAA